MNYCILSGRVSQPYFDLLPAQQGVQPFLTFLLSVRGPRAEGDSTARIVQYGPEAQNLYPLLREGLFVEVEGRFRQRRDPHRQKVYEFVARRVEIPATQTLPTIELADVRTEEAI